VIEVSGVYKSVPFSQTFTIDESGIFDTDSLSEEIWAGNYIGFLESQTQTNEIINEIVNFSIGERVLSYYSAFICLEPGMEVCYDCLDNPNPPPLDAIDSSEIVSDFAILNAYPNPFNSSVTINIKLPSLITAENVTFRIYNILGEVVRTFQSDYLQPAGNYRFIWDGKNDNGSDVTSGIYLFIITTPQTNYSLKLMLMK